MAKDTIASAEGKPSVADILAKLLKSPKPTEKKSGFEVRPTTTGFCVAICGNDASAGALFACLLELWVESSKRVERHGKDWLFLSLDDLHNLSGLSIRAIADRALPRIVATTFFELDRGRVKRGDVNRYMIRFDEAAFWDEVRFSLNPTMTVTSHEHGAAIVAEKVDRRKLPYHFKRLYDRQTGNE